MQSYKTLAQPSRRKLTTNDAVNVEHDHGLLPCRFLSMLGDGVTSQVVLAEDTFRPDAQPVAVKILKRQHSYAGQKASSAKRPQARNMFCHAVVQQNQDQNPMVYHWWLFLQ